MTAAAVPFIAVAYLLALACITYGVREREPVQAGCGIFLAILLTLAVAS